MAGNQNSDPLVVDDHNRVGSLSVLNTTDNTGEHKVAVHCTTQIVPFDILGILRRETAFLVGDVQDVFGINSRGSALFHNGRSCCFLLDGIQRIIGDLLGLHGRFALLARHKRIFLSLHSFFQIDFLPNGRLCRRSSGFLLLFGRFSIRIGLAAD